MGRLGFELLGGLRVTVDGAPRELTPYTSVLLLRLLLARGGPVTVDQLHRDVWPDDFGTGPRPGRIKVQQRIVELRRALDPGRPGEASEVLRTLRGVASDHRGAASSYRLDVPAEAVDAFRLEELLRQAGSSAAADAVEPLERALALWRGEPLTEAGDRPFVAAAAAELCGMRDRAQAELVRAYAAVGRIEEAVGLGEELLTRRPDDATGALVARLRGRLTSHRPRGIIHYQFAHPDVTVTVEVGDLFDQDAHLVVGFSDTFDTSTDDDRVISVSSVQGQLLTREFAGDRAALDRALRRALARTAPTGKELRQDKPWGRLLRYPLGTVAVIRDIRRSVFAVAYSTMGNDLICRSDEESLRLALDRLWEAVYLSGHRRPVAMPLIGSGLARVDTSTPQQLVELVVSSFIARSRRGLVCPELRLVLREETLRRIDPVAVTRFLRTL